MSKGTKQHREVLQEMGRKFPMIFNIITTRKFSVLSSDDIYCKERLYNWIQKGSDQKPRVYVVL
jgi:hypothetical protein